MTLQAETPETPTTTSLGQARSDKGHSLEKDRREIRRNWEKDRLEVLESTSRSRRFPIQRQASQGGFRIGVKVNFQNVNPSYTEGLAGKHPKPNRVDLSWFVLSASPVGAKGRTRFSGTFCREVERQ